MTCELSRTHVNLTAISKVLIKIFLAKKIIKQNIYYRRGRFITSSTVAFGEIIDARKNSTRECLSRVFKKALMK